MVSSKNKKITSSSFIFFHLPLLCFVFFFYVANTAKTEPDRKSPPEMGNGVLNPPDKSSWSHGFGTWNPTYPATECSAALHNKYWVRGPDGKIYHTWHPTFAWENGKKCFFGHEHGDDPSTSNSFRFEPVPFGYLNNVLGGTKRHEDHVGHKIDIFNDAIGKDYPDIVRHKCDTMIKVHMGSHSNDAFVNSAHEVFVYANCEDGRYIKVKLIQILGPFGEFRATDTCQVQNFIKVNTTKYPKEKLEHGIKAPVEYMASRGIPYRDCVEKQILKPPGVPSELERFAEEHWRLFIRLDWKEQNLFFELNPYLHVFDPIRYYDPNIQTPGPNVYNGYFVDLCYLTGAKQINAGPCNKIRSTPGIKWNSPKSPFLGAIRDFGPNGLSPVMNRAGKSTFWTDVYLQNPSFARPGPKEYTRIEQVVKGNVPNPLPVLNYGMTKKDFRAEGLHGPN